MTAPAEGRLITVKNPLSHLNAEDSRSILPEQLLEHNYDTLKEHYCIHDLQNLSKVFQPGENIYILGHEVTDDFPLHNHDFYELTYVSRGEIVNVVDGNELYMHRGDISLINGEALQSIKCINKTTYIINFCIKKEMMIFLTNNLRNHNSPLMKFIQKSDSDIQNYIYFPNSFAADIHLFVNRILQEYINAEFRQTYVLELWTALLIDTLDKSKYYSYLGINHKAQEILRHIEGHCFEQSLSEMAEILGYHANYLSDYLKKHTGKNYREIQRECRLEKSLQLLENPTISIYDISERCGYSSPSHFFRVFKERYGMTPGKYRAALKQ